MKRKDHFRIMAFGIAILVSICFGCIEPDLFAAETENSLQDAINAYNRKAYNEAFHILKPLAESGNPTAQGMLGEMYYLGLGVSSNCHKACSWFEKAAEGDNAVSYVYLGEIHTFGKCGDTDFKKGVDYYLRGIALGHVLAANNLAWFYATVEYPEYQKPGKAIQYALMAIQTAPDEARFYDTLAAAYARDGQFEKAIETIKKAITLLKEMTTIPVTEKQKMEAEFITRLHLYTNRKPYNDKAIRYRRSI